MSRDQIINGNTILGIEFGSTRIKSILIDRDHKVIASGSHEWENDYIDGVWTYSEESIMNGLRSSYADLKKDVFNLLIHRISASATLGLCSVLFYNFLTFDNSVNY